jgi:hypothetical protein
LGDTEPRIFEGTIMQILKRWTPLRVIKYGLTTAFLMGGLAAVFYVATTFSGE